MDEDQTALRFAAADSAAALCTIVGIDGSFSRRLGAQLAVAADGSTVGSLADGCLERELAAQAAALRGHGPKVLRYGQGSPFIDFRLPCGSGLDVLVDPAPDRAALMRAVAQLDQRQLCELALPVTGPGLLSQRRYIPSLRLALFGAGPELRWLERLAAGFGADCNVAGPDTGLALGRAPEGIALDAWTAVVLLFHDHEWEIAILEWALASQAFHIGAIGGQPARESRIAELERRGWRAEDLTRVKSPIGLIHRARDVRVLALSILAEAVEAYECLHQTS